MITGGERMRQLLESLKLEVNRGGQVIDLYNQQVHQGISTTIKTTIDSSCNTFVTTMEGKTNLKKGEVLYTAPNGKRYAMRIRKFTPRDCFRLMGVKDKDIDKLVAIGSDGNQVISNSKLYQLAGNSIVTNCMTAMFEELFYPSQKNYVEKDGQTSLF